LIAHGEKVSSGRPEFSGERAGLEAALNDAFADEVGTRLALAAAGDGAMIGDVEGPVISLINLSSLAVLERELGQALDPRRFRANLYFAGAPAWTERAWPGRQIRIGGATLDVIAPIRRCAATEVNPDTTDRDAAVLRGLKKGFDHTEMGVYARTVTPGEISPGAVLAV
jgi:uncharacterized protein YcbX